VRPDAFDAERLVPVLRLQRADGVGPVLARRMIERFADAERACGAREPSLLKISGVGPAKAERIAAGLRDSPAIVEEELAHAERIGVGYVVCDEESYPALLRPLPDAPLTLCYRGDREALRHPYGVAIVGSRACSAYGVEQAERFASALAQAGLTIVSGGARGIDTAAHRGALRAGGRTIVVSGCGLARTYPPENKDLFDRVAGEGGAIVSELPLATEPAPENFPARNRIVSGVALGVLVIEAGARSGALITARQAAEEQGREVMALPGRVDSQHARGSLELLKQGGAALVTDPGDVLDILEAPARHLHEGTHAERYSGGIFAARGVSLFDGAPESGPVLGGDLTESQRTLVEALGEPRSFEELAGVTGLAPETLRADVTLLEIRRLVVRRGGLLERRRGG
jgi:DNA processing protein